MVELKDLRPVKDYVCLEIVEESDFAGLIALPQIRGKTRPHDIGIIRHLGPDALKMNPELEVGQKVITVRFGKETVLKDGKKVQMSIVRANAIEAVLEDDENG